jgi:hypothetical protein
VLVQWKFDGHEVTQDAKVAVHSVSVLNAKTRHCISRRTSENDKNRGLLRQCKQKKWKLNTGYK